MHEGWQQVDEEKPDNSTIYLDQCLNGCVSEIDPRAYTHHSYY